MQEQIHIVFDGLGVLALVAVFGIVLVVAQRAMKEMSFFGQTGSWVVACCVALLSVVGCVRFFGVSDQPTRSGGQPDGTGGLFDFMLVGYVALSVALVLTLLLAWVQKFLGHQNTTRPDEKTLWKRQRRPGPKERCAEFKSTQDLRRLRRSGDPTTSRKEHHCQQSEKTIRRPTIN